jgi:hypothetical protein
MRLLAWPVTALGLVVILGAAFVYFEKDLELERQYWLAHERTELRSSV